MAEHENRQVSLGQSDFAGIGTNTVALLASDQGWPHPAQVFVGLTVPGDIEGDGPDNDGEEPLAASAGQPVPRGSGDEARRRRGLVVFVHRSATTRGSRSLSAAPRPSTPLIILFIPVATAPTAGDATAGRSRPS